MLGIELSEILSFTMQVGLSLAGAAALWGFVFTKWSKHNFSSNECLIHEWLGLKLLIPFVGGFVLFLLSWFILSAANTAGAHEGIVLSPLKDSLPQQAQNAAPLVLLWIASLVGAAGIKKFRPAFFSRNLEWLYVAQLPLLMGIMMLLSWQGDISRSQFFLWGHSLHSILTVGTVLTLDFLFLLSRPSLLLKQHVYPLFPTLSKVIWVGLGIEFLSVLLVFNEAILLTPKFFFMQTVVGILIINGVLLAGPVMRKMLASIQQNQKQLSTSWERIGNLAGVVSIASWGTITLVDSLKHLTLNYVELMSVYLALIFVLYLGHTLAERLHKQPPAFLNS